MALNKRMGDLHYMLGRHFFTQRTVRHWNKLYREVLGVTTLEAFKIKVGWDPGQPDLVAGKGLKVDNL